MYPGCRLHSTQGLPVLRGVPTPPAPRAHRPCPLEQGPWHLAPSPATGAGHTQARGWASVSAGPGCQEGPSLTCRPPILPWARAPRAKATGGCCRWVLGESGGTLCPAAVTPSSLPSKTGHAGPASPVATCVCCSHMAPVSEHTSRTLPHTGLGLPAGGLCPALTTWSLLQGLAPSSTAPPPSCRSPYPPGG